jgi:hypothetical protein
MSMGVSMMAYSITNQQPADSDAHLAFLGAVGGGFILLLAILGGHAKWVIEPTSAKVFDAKFKDHLNDVSAHQNAAEHRHLPIMDRLERIEERGIEEREAIMEKMDEIREKLSQLVAEHRAIVRNGRADCTSGDRG